MKNNTDPNNVTVAFLNKSNETIQFESIHPKKIMQPVQWLQVKCPAKMFVQLPHSYYVISTKSGAEIPVEKFWGQNIDRLKKEFPKQFAFTPESARF